MKSSPIYNIIDIPGRASNRSFGADSGFTQDIRVGTSASNSHTLAKISVQQYKNDDGTTTFRLLLDGYPFREGLLKGKSFDHWALSPLDRPDYPGL